MDATVLMLLFHPDAKPPIDPSTSLPLARCKERIELLLQQLSKNRIQILVPTPVLSEILVTSGVHKARILGEITSTSAFKVHPFDEIAAVEVAMLSDPDLQSNKKLTDIETKAKVKFDRQIIAIAKTNGVKAIYTDDVGLGRKARENGIVAVTTAELPLPSADPQPELPLEIGVQHVASSVEPPE